MTGLVFYHPGDYSRVVDIADLRAVRDIDHLFGVTTHASCMLPRSEDYSGSYNYFPMKKVISSEIG
jgi:hypothetical protein